MLSRQGSNQIYVYMTIRAPVSPVKGWSFTKVDLAKVAAAETEVKQRVRHIGIHRVALGQTSGTLSESGSSRSTMTQLP